jgi:hypothetical protein
VGGETWAAFMRRCRRSESFDWDAYVEKIRERFGNVHDEAEVAFGYGLNEDGSDIPAVDIKTRLAQRMTARRQRLREALQTRLTSELHEQEFIREKANTLADAVVSFDPDEEFGMPMVLMLCGAAGTGKTTFVDRVLVPALKDAGYTVGGPILQILSYTSTFGSERQTNLLRSMEDMAFDAGDDNVEEFTHVPIPHINELGVGLRAQGQLAFWSTRFRNEDVKYRLPATKGSPASYVRVDVSSFIIVATTNFGAMAIEQLRQGCARPSLHVLESAVRAEFDQRFNLSVRVTSRLLQNIVPFRDYSLEEGERMARHMLRVRLQSMHVMTDDPPISVRRVRAGLAEMCCRLWFRDGRLRLVGAKLDALLTTLHLNCLANTQMLALAHEVGVEARLYVPGDGSGAPMLQMRIFSEQGDGEEVASVVLSDAVPVSSVDGAGMFNALAGRLGRTALWLNCANVRITEVEQELGERSQEYIGRVDARGRNALMAVCACDPVPDDDPDACAYRISSVQPHELERRARIVRLLLKTGRTTMLPHHALQVDVTGADACVLLLQAVNYHVERIALIVEMIWQAQGSPYPTMEAARSRYLELCPSSRPLLDMPSSAASSASSSSTAAASASASSAASSSAALAAAAVSTTSAAVPLSERGRIGHLGQTNSHVVLTDIGVSPRRLPAAHRLLVVHVTRKLGPRRIVRED